MESVAKQRHIEPTLGRFGKKKAKLMVSIEDSQEEEKHEVVPKSNRLLEYIMMMQQAYINHINEALTETESKSKYVSNEVDSKIWKLEDEIVLSQHQNNDEVNTRDCVVLKGALKEEAYA